MEPTYSKSPNKRKGPNNSTGLNFWKINKRTGPNNSTGSTDF